MPPKDKTVRTYQVLSPIRVDPKSREMLTEGDTIDLPADQAEELIAVGSIRVPEAKAKKGD